MTRQNLFVLFQTYIWYVHNRRLLVFVEHFCVYLRRGQLPVTKELRNGVYIGAEVKHHDGEGMPGTMESNLFGDACTKHPFPDGMIGW